MRKLIIICLMMSLGISDSVVIYGDGQTTCSIYLDQQATDEFQKQYHGAYIMGFISALNYSYNVSKKIDVKTLISYIDNYCRENPLKAVAHGLVQLSNEIRKKE